MKKSIILFFALVISAGALVSFKVKNATKYGGSGSAKISIYKKMFIPGGSKRGDKVSSPTINVTIDCYERSDAAAREKIEQKISREAGYKTTFDQEWEYDTEITYRITSCD